MNIYVAHSRKSDFKNELYQPIRQNFSNSKHVFVLPHEKLDENFNSKEFFKEGCDLVIAEVSDASIGLGIELGWANIFNIPIICIYRKGSKISGALSVVSKEFFEYDNTEELIKILKGIYLLDERKST